MPPTAPALDRADRYAALRREEQAERLQADREALDERALRAFFTDAQEQVSAEQQRRDREISQQIRDEQKAAADTTSWIDGTRQALAESERRAYLAPAAVAARAAEAYERRVALDDRLCQTIGACETKRIVDPTMRASFDAAHPGGADGCPCRGHQLFRKDIQPGDPIEPDHKVMDLEREVRVLAARERLHEATAELVRRGIPVPSFG